MVQDEDGRAVGEMQGQMMLLEKVIEDNEPRFENESKLESERRFEVENELQLKSCSKSD